MSSGRTMNTVWSVTKDLVMNSDLRHRYAGSFIENPRYSIEWRPTSALVLRQFHSYCNTRLILRRTSTCLGTCVRGTSDFYSQLNSHNHLQPME